MLGEARPGQSFPPRRPLYQSPQIWEGPSRVTQAFCDVRRVETIDFRAYRGRDGLRGMTRHESGCGGDGRHRKAGGGGFLCPLSLLLSVHVEDAVSQPAQGLDRKGLLSSHCPGLLAFQLSLWRVSVGIHPFCLSSLPLPS